MTGTHACFTPPNEPDVPIWRYLDLERLVSMLSKSCLFFSRSDLLGDPFEGSVSIPTVIGRHLLVAEMLASAPGLNMGEFLATESEITRRFREWTFINCWHMSEHESAAMWSLYGRSVAIRSTYRKLHDSISSPFIYIGVVRYIDYARDVVTRGNTYWPFVYKRKSFEHERELRVVLQDGTCCAYAGWSKLAQTQAGREIEVNLRRLKEAVHVAPQTPAWKREAIESVVRRFGLETPVLQSALDADALF